MDGWLARIMRGRHQSRSQTPPRQPLSFERLESRTLLDASASLLGGILTVTGAVNRDHLKVSLDSIHSQLVVTDSGRELGRYPNSAVNEIDIAAGNASSVQIGMEVQQAAKILGGTGPMVLEAGSGPTTLVAGSGNEKLIGGWGPSILMGGSGNDTLVSRSGQDILQAGSGATKLLVRGTDRLIGVTGSVTIYGQLAPGNTGGVPQSTKPADPASTVLATSDVSTLLNRAAALTPSDDGIVAIVDREGNILGVRVEQNVSPAITGNTGNLVFAIDGAVSLARTGAFFANDQAPLTSRTIQFISQTTITQREVESNPSITDPNSTVAGPGFVAPIQIGGHFPPGIQFTPQVDLFGIEHTNRDTSTGLIPGDGRFNVPSQFIPPGQGLPEPDSYGVVSGLLPTARSRGIATLPGGVPIYKNGELVGGIGVFFPGTTGYADAENSALSANYDPTKPDRSLEAELIAFAAVGGSPNASSPSHPAGTFDFRGAIGNAPALPSGFGIFLLGTGQINLVGITLDIFGPGGRNGPDVLLSLAQHIGFGTGNPLSGSNQLVDKMGDTLLNGTAVPTGWLVTPHDGVNLTAAQVTQIIDQGIASAQSIRAAIRLPFDVHADYVFAVADTSGNILGLYRMPDATYFSIDVAVAKSRNVAYYDNPSELQPIDQLPGVPAGVAFTNRTFRYLAEPFFPEGIDTKPPAPFSILNDGGVDPHTGLNVGPPLPASAFQSIMGHDAFNPETNFHQPANPNQNGIVFFPGSTPLYQTSALAGALGVSGDGVDQDDDATFFASNGFQVPPTVIRADQVTFQGVPLPFLNFNRNPIEP
jgi:uncharacterized protein GlcG (DUF336 family)